MTGPSIELVQATPPPGPTPDQRPGRLLVFLSTFVLAATLGLAANYLRSPVFETSATVLTVKPKGVDETSADADLEHVAIQRRLLLGDEILAAVADRLQSADHTGESPMDMGRLREMLTVRSVSDTNLVELSAEGGTPELLRDAVNQWADAYVALRAARIAELTGRTTAELQAEQSRLGERLAGTRAELQRFRERHDIVSMEREENLVLARLNGLTASLNRARERETDARAQLDALRSAIAQGRPVVPDHEKARLATLQSDARGVRERLEQMQERYTDRYIERDPDLRDLPVQLATLETQIQHLVSVGQAQATIDAEHALLSAAEAVRSLETELAEHRAQVAEFTNRFAEHRALEQDLTRLEELYTTQQERLARIEISNREQFPPLEVIDYAPLPLTPVRPAYTRDAGIVLGAALLMALFLAWLVDYLTGTPRPDRATTGVRILGGPSGYLPALGREPELKTLNGPSTPPFPAASPRELEPAEVDALLSAAKPVTALQAALLLSGVQPEELPTLAKTLEPHRETLDVSGPSARCLTLAPAVHRYANAVAEAQADQDWTDEALRADLQIAAADAGLVDPAGATPEALQHTYVAYLVRQGARLGELPQRIGRIPATQLSRYASLSPPGANQPLVGIDPFYPALRH